MRFWLLAILLAASSASTEGLTDPHADYLLYCRGCHLHTGDAVPDANVPSLHELAPLLQTAKGREYIVRVPGVSQTPMSDERLAAVLNWVMTEFNGDTLPADHKPYTPEEVGRARQKALTDPLKTRAEILGDS